MVNIKCFQENEGYHAPLAFTSLEFIVDLITNVFKLDDNF